MSDNSPLPRTPSFRLDGRRALVSGAGRGIGRAIAVAFADAGAEVTLVSRTLSEIKTVAAGIKENGGKATILELDVMDRPRTTELITAQAPFDILVNNAGGNRPQELSDITAEDYDAVTDLNVRSVIFLCQTVAKGMIAENIKGSIINISSQMGHVGGPKRIVYCATKHAIEGATKAMAWELGAHGIRANTLCPTFIETPMTAHMLEDEDFREFVTSKIALGRIGQVEDVMGAAVFLASDASALVTGSSLMVDGGWTAA